MAFSLAKVKNLLNSNRNERLSGSGSLEPEIGFKLVHNSATKCLYVTVIGARHLPSLFGLTRAKGYIVKVKVFPGDAKFESQLQDTSWPVWNEEFKFQLGKSTGKIKKPSQGSTDLATQIAGHFISLTIYALLETVPSKSENDKKKKAGKNAPVQTSETQTESQSTSKLAMFEKYVKETFKGNSNSQTNKTLGDKRRTIGTATYSLDPKMFQNDLKYDLTGTPDIWRPIEQMNSGVSGADATKENKKGQVEISLLYTTSENGRNDFIQITVTKMRCNIQTMQQQEILKAPLYLKASLSNQVSESHWKSERFMPTISARWDPKSSTAKLPVDSSHLSAVSIYVSLGCKNQMGVKEILGKIVIGEKSPAAELWQNAIKSPGIPKTQWLPFE